MTDMADHVELVHDRFHKLIARAWADPEFKARLLGDTDAVFREAGVAIPDGVTPRVHENTSDTWNFVLPPQVSDLADEPLKAADIADSCVCTCCCGYTTAVEQQLGEMMLQHRHTRRAEGESGTA